MKKTNLILGTFFLIMIGVFSFYVIKSHYYDQIKPFLKQEAVKEDLSSIIKEHAEYKEQEQRLHCMARTLMIAYNLSKHEAHYYSIFFDDFSKAYDIPWEIYPALIRIESNFNGTLVSSKSAKGMTQLLESTAKSVAKDLKINYTESQTIWNDVVNIILGCTYLSTAIKKKGLEGGVYVYLGGPDYLKSLKSNKDTEKYLTQYKSTVWKEFLQLSYIFRGVVNEQGLDYIKLHRVPYTDSVSTEETVLPDILPDVINRAYDTSIFQDTLK